MGVLLGDEKVVFYNLGWKGSPKGKCLAVLDNNKLKNFCTEFFLT